MLSFAYRTITNIGAPAISLYLLKRRIDGREDQNRFSERLGRASRPRPAGRLVWCHAASVGEAASILALIDRMRMQYPDLNILITTGTITSARMLAARLPPEVIHQYVPVDRSPYVARFLKHWRPDFAIFIESELWPNILSALNARMIPAAIVNGRMSYDSFRRWHRFKSWARELLSVFVIALTQTEDDRGRFAALGANQVRCFGNLKYAARPLPVDDAELKCMRDIIGTRPLWLMASSHRGEEAMACATHEKLREKWPDLLTIIAPRHAVRGDEAARLIEARGLSLARRSAKDEIKPETDIYLADTMGDLGLLYRLSQIVALGGSFVHVGGHNPIEPAQLDCAIVLGPYMHNFAAVAREFTRSKAVLQIRHANELTATIERLLNAPAERVKYITAARVVADRKRQILEQVVDALAPWLKPSAKKAA